MTHILSIQVGAARPVHINGRRIMTAFAKQPVEGPVTVGVLGLAGDEQADPTVHGGTFKAVYAYPSEHADFWRTQRCAAGLACWDDWRAGSAGENLTLAGLLESDTGWATVCAWAPACCA